MRIFAQPVKLAGALLAPLLMVVAGCMTDPMAGPRSGELPADVPVEIPVSSAAPAVPVAPASSDDEPSAEYALRVGDNLDVKFFYDPQLNENVVIRPDGRISLQLIGDVVAAGRTPTELTEALRERYDAVLREPEVAVIVRQFARGKVYVGGEVAKPGIIELDGTLSALQAIMQSGGFTTGAEERSVVLLRNRGSNEPATFQTVNLHDQLERIRYTDVMLEPSDVLYIPQKQIAQAAEFFEEYVNKIVPIYRNMGLNFFFDLNKSEIPTVQ